MACRKREMAAVLFMALTGGAVFAQKADKARSDGALEARRYAHRRGPDGAPQWIAAALAYLGGSGARNLRDSAYLTLGMSRSEADARVFAALRAQSRTVAAAVFWALLRAGGPGAFNAAQRQARDEFKRIHHGSEWSGAYGRWHPSNGHIRAPFPHCTRSCAS